MIKCNMGDKIIQLYGCTPFCWVEVVEFLVPSDMMASWSMFVDFFSNR